MTQADTPMPGEDPGALIEDPSRLDEIEPVPEADPDRVPKIPSDLGDEAEPGAPVGPASTIAR